MQDSQSASVCILFDLMYTVINLRRFTLALVQSRVSDELKTAFSNYCKAQNTSEAKVLKRYLSELTSSQNALDQAIENQPRTNKITIRLHDKMIAKVDARLSFEGYETRTDWVTSCVLASLNNAAVLTQDEQKMLRESNMQLAAIGRNLNQIVRHMNKDEVDSHQVSGEIIEDIVAEVDTIKRSVSNLIRKNRTRWA